MSEFDDAMSEALDEAMDVLGRESVQFEGVDQPVQVDWNGGNARETLEVQGITFNVVATIVVKLSALRIPPRIGQKVRKDGVTYVISGTLAADNVAYTLALDSADIAQ